MNEGEYGFKHSPRTNFPHTHCDRIVEEDNEQPVEAPKQQQATAQRDEWMTSAPKDAGWLLGRPKQEEKKEEEVDDTVCCFQTLIK